jgi:NAD(P)-dependent dehydrogenase (short-subunit alcohol dehydrogenase family)
MPVHQNSAFTHRVVVITGGAGGIGRCLVETFAREGAHVAFIDRDEEAGMALEGLLRENGCQALFHAGDIADPNALTAFATAVTDRFKGVDILVNNACLSRKGILSGCSAEDFQYVQQVGVTAPYLLSRLFLPHFKPGAAIVNIASTRAFQSQPDTESYSAAKGGILALTHALAVSLAHRVRVNAVSPGWIDTSDWHGKPTRLGGNTPDITMDKPGSGASGPHLPPGTSAADPAQHPANRIGDPPDIARAVRFLCHPDNSFITGQNLTVDGGMTAQMIYHGEEGWTYTPCLQE